jgi:DNA-binding MarR family transcriptional regulator
VTAAASARLANLLGALSLALSDRMLEAPEGTAGLSATAMAALSALDQFLERPTVDQLSRVVGLTQSGAVRLVDRLEGDGLVRREPGPDRRTALITLTPSGRQAARTVAAARLHMLGDALAPLSVDDEETLAPLIGRLLVGLMREPGATRWICRMCDLTACGRPDGHCPIEQEARRRFG